MERLPRELLWKIIEHVPECCNTLRLTSRLLRTRIDEFALESTSLPLVGLRFLGCTELIPAHNSLGLIMLSISVPECTSDLLARRFVLLDLPSDFKDRVKRVNLIMKDDEGGYVKLADYQVNVDAWKDNDSEIKYFKTLMGKRIGKVNIIIEQGYKIEMDVLEKVLDGLQFSRMDIFANRLSDEAVRFLLGPIKSDRIDHFILDAIEIAIPNPMGFLLFLSSHVRSIHIKRPFVQKAEESYSIGMIDCNWTPVIFEMFTRRMSTLQIDSKEEVFCINCVTALKNHLPQLAKKLWLGASFMDEIGELSILEIEA